MYVSPRDAVVLLVVSISHLIGRWLIDALGVTDSARSVIARRAIRLMAITV